MQACKSLELRPLLISGSGTGGAEALAQALAPLRLPTPSGWLAAASVGWLGWLARLAARLASSLLPPFARVRFARVRCSSAHGTNARRAAVRSHADAPHA